MARVMHALRRASSVVPWLIGISGVLFYLGWEIAHHGVYAYTQSVYAVDDADEWRYVACSRLVAHGYSLFDQVFSAQPPLLFTIVAGGMRIFGDSITGARSVEILFGILALISVAWIVARLVGPWGAAASVAILAISPGFLIYFHTIEAEGPMVALMALSLAFCVESDRSARDATTRTKEADASGRARHRAVMFALLGGLVLAAATLTKLFAVEAVLPGVWILAARRSDVREAFPIVGVFLLGLCIPVVVDFAAVSPADQWRQVVLLHNSAAAAHLPDLTPAHEIILNFLGLDAGLSIVALAGLLALTLCRRWWALGLVGLWLVGSLAMLLLFRPLFPHHAAILLAPLGTAAGVAVGVGAEALEVRRKAVLAVVAVAILAYAGLGIRVAHDDRRALYVIGGTPSDALAAFITDHTAPGDLVAADDTRAADLSGRLIAPPLCDPSTVRLKSGYLTAQDLIAATTAYRVRLIASTTGLFAQVPRYISWLKRHYRAVPWPGKTTVYVRP